MKTWLDYTRVIAIHRQHIAKRFVSFAVTQNKNRRQNEKVYDEINLIGKVFVYYNLLF